MTDNNQNNFDLPSLDSDTSVIKGETISPQPATTAQTIATPTETTTQGNTQPSTTSTVEMTKPISFSVKAAPVQPKKVFIRPVNKPNICGYVRGEVELYKNYLALEQAVNNAKTVYESIQADASKSQMEKDIAKTTFDNTLKQKEEFAKEYPNKLRELAKSSKIKTSFFTDGANKVKYVANVSLDGFDYRLDTYTPKIPGLLEGFIHFTLNPLLKIDINSLELIPGEDQDLETWPTIKEGILVKLRSQDAEGLIDWTYPTKKLVNFYFDPVLKSKTEMESIISANKTLRYLESEITDENGNVKETKYMIYQGHATNESNLGLGIPSNRDTLIKRQLLNLVKDIVKSGLGEQKANEFANFIENNVYTAIASGSVNKTYNHNATTDAEKAENNAIKRNFHNQFSNLIKKQLEDFSKNGSLKVQIVRKDMANQNGSYAYLQIDKK
ncbi:MAG: hypothetical protein ACRC4M_04050 [Mycoplasma sp.]